MASTSSGRRDMAGSTGRPSLTTDSVTDQLRALILDGALGIGVQLKQEALAARFGVSRIPVREALKRLEAEGLITHRSEEHTSELKSLMRISYAVFCLKTKHKT